ncbi:DUF4386 domain-containing protein [Halobacillus litoralis]|uniref:DUF4386 domain-containing protein n=1 Tax=Halobacillus litoralis TaxID=45668 RepID=UPI001CD66E57|nr:DUF4386 domain-containing protein [Halobacillus litoralis]MCA0970679.1 DUF4386 domain-containing protein [Halobacillus litoralis]
MTSLINNQSPMKMARIAGVTYLVLYLAGMFAEFFVRSSLYVQGDASATASNIMDSELLFRWGITSDVVMIISDITLAVIFYVLFKPVSHYLSTFAAFFRMTQASILGVNLLNLFIILHLLSGAEYLSSFSNEQLHSLVMTFVHAHDVGYSIGLIFFGVSLLFFGILVMKSAYVPKVLGFMLIIASIGYFVDSFAKILMHDYEKYAAIFDSVVFMPAAIAEMAFILWLLIKGVNVTK